MTWSSTVRRILVIWAALPSLFSLSAQQISWTPEARDAHHLLTRLRLDEGLTAVRLNRYLQPDNLIWTFLEDYGEFLSVFTQEDLRRMPAFFAASDARLEALESLPETNPLSLMAQAQVSLHHAALHLQQGEFISAGTDINRGFKLLKRNQRQFPGDVANLRLYAALKAAFGAVPDQYRWLIAMLTSLTGTIDEGLGELHRILDNSTPAENPFYHETVLFTALAEGKLHRRPEEALQLLIRHFGDTPPDKGTQFVMARLLKVAGKNDEAIRILSLSLPGPQIPYLSFLLGQCKMYRGDSDAREAFEAFLRQHQGKHYIKEAYQKLAWLALLRHDQPGYVRNMQEVLLRGSATTDEDKQALREAEYHETPHPLLLQARLAYDGGYYARALDHLTDEAYKTLHQLVHRLEFLYRKGRVFQARQQDAEALHYFHLAINIGRYDSSYFACSSALQCGLIHENLGHREQAATYYKMCLDFAPDTYSTGLHQEAEMGLNRLGY